MSQANCIYERMIKKTTEKKIRFAKKTWQLSLMSGLEAVSFEKARGTFIIITFTLDLYCPLLRYFLPVGMTYS